MPILLVSECPTWVGTNKLNDAIIIDAEIGLGITPMLKEFTDSTQSPPRTCPDTGCDLLCRPEWTDAQMDDGYKSTVSILDGRIINSRPVGYVTLSGIKPFLSLLNEIIDTYIPQRTPFIVIEDFSKCTGAATEARRHFIKIMKKHDHLIGMIFYGASTLFKISVKLGKRFYKGPGRIEIVKNHSTAVHLAQTMITQSSSPQLIEVLKPPELIGNRKHEAQADPIPSHREWSKRLDGFSIEFRTIDTNVLYATARGFLKTEYVSHISELREKATMAINPNRIDYTISDVTQLTGATHKARLAYMQSLKTWSQNQPFKMFIYVGAKRFMRTAINLARPLMPFKVRVAGDLENALDLIHRDRQRLSSPTELEQPTTPASLQDTDQIQRYVQEMLGYLGAIDWEPGSTEQQHNANPSHPFFPIYEAVKLIKDELNGLFDEKNEAEKKLQEANSELESRVRKRTADLERVNRELMIEIIERKQTLIELQQAKLTAEKANRAKSEFLANMSHELRTPLNHIIGFTEIVLDQHFGPLNEKQAEHLQDVTGSSQHLLSLINDILDLSKVEAGKLKLACTPIHLAQLLQDSLKMIQEKAYAQNITISLEASDAPTTIQADNRMFRQIIYNLLSNAVKFTPEGGHISINTYLHRIESSLVSPMVSKHQTSTFQAADNDFAEWFNKQNTPLVEIAVKDTGIGIRPNDLHRIFRAFEQADSSSSRLYQGTGLGLSLTQKLIELHGGRIWVESPGEGHGSVFRFFIPISQKTKS